jgi:Calcineurin-like phosphoesterase
MFRSDLQLGIRFAWARLIISIVTRAFIFAAAIGASTCSPYLPPTTVPPTPDAQVEPFRTALQAYVDQTQPYRKQAAQAGNQVSGQTGAAPNAEAGLRARQNTLADALSTKLRSNAMQGDLFVPGAAATIRRDVMQVFNGVRHDLLMDALAEQNDTGKAASPAPPIMINQHIDAPRVPPLLLDSLPPLPKQLEYDFVGRTLLLRDVDADVVVDFLADTLPELPAGVPTAPPAPVSASATPSPLPMPSIRGGTVLVLIGDSGSGDIAQQSVAQAMLGYFTTAYRFPFVLMLGDNLYDDDYTGEFLVPYKPLLDRGVTFYATLGNHDRDLQQHFKPFNMQDRDYYTFDRGNARFVALNSNHPADPAQAKWLDAVFADAGTKWRICFFHHPLYSSGQHADESRNVIRPALEPILVRNHVDVVFSGHDHLYERVAPQNGIRYFVSGGGGRNLYAFRASAFDEVGISEHHFMVVEIAGDRLFYEAITQAQKLLDCGLLYRTRDAASKPPDKDTQTWLAACRSAGPSLTH